MPPQTRKTSLSSTIPTSKGACVHQEEPRTPQVGVPPRLLHQHLRGPQLRRHRRMLRPLLQHPPPRNRVVGLRARQQQVATRVIAKLVSMRVVRATGRVRQKIAPRPAAAARVKFLGVVSRSCLSTTEVGTNWTHAGSFP